MTGETPAGGPSGGLLDHARELIAAGLEYLRARLALAGMEAREATVHFAVIGGLLVLAIAVVVFGYLFFCIALTVLVARWLGISPGWVILALAALHFAVAIASGFIAIVRLKKGVFSATLAELQKDQLWLSRKSK